MWVVSYYDLLCDLCFEIFFIVAINRFEMVSSKCVDLLQLKLTYKMEKGIGLVVNLLIIN